MNLLTLSRTGRRPVLHEVQVEVEGLTHQQEEQDGRCQPHRGGCGVPRDQHQLLHGGHPGVAQTVHRAVSSGNCKLY